MLPKPEKNKKNIPSAEQLTLDGPIKKEVNLKQKRTFVAATLIFSVLLCVSFSLYHQVKNKSFKVTFPTIKTNTSSAPDELKKYFSNTLSSEKNVWSIYAKDLNSNSEINWSQNQSDFVTNKDFVLNQISDLKNNNSNSGLLNNVLPGGVVYVDNRQNQNGDLTYISLLTVPQKDILIYFKISNGASLNQDHLNLKISQISEKIYRNLVGF